MKQRRYVGIQFPANRPQWEREKSLPARGAELIQRMLRQDPEFSIIQSK